MKNWLIFILFYVLLKISNCQFTCDPFLDCENADVGENVPDPEDCNQYYICVLLSTGEVIPSAVSISCKSGQYFDQVTATCINETEPCRNICPPENYCTTKCPMPFDRVVQVASKIDCTHLTICKNESETLLRCSEEKPYFNGHDCVEDETQCCDFCSPFCSHIDLPIQDPCSCSSFYNCLEVGRLTNDTESIPCDVGQYFDEDLGQCENGTCINICPSCRFTDATTIESTTEYITGPPLTDPAIIRGKKEDGLN